MPQSLGFGITERKVRCWPSGAVYQVGRLGGEVPKIVIARPDGSDHMNQGVQCQILLKRMGSLEAL